MARRAKQMILMTREAMILFGYEAFRCSFVRTSIVPKFATVETVIMADWKCVKIESDDAKRV